MPSPFTVGVGEEDWDDSGGENKGEEDKEDVKLSREKERKGEKKKEKKKKKRVFRREESWFAKEKQSFQQVLLCCVVPFPCAL